MKELDGQASRGCVAAQGSARLGLSCGLSGSSQTPPRLSTQYSDCLDPVGIMFKCRIWFSRSEDRSAVCIFKGLLGDAKAEGPSTEHILRSEAVEGLRLV